MRRLTVPAHRDGPKIRGYRNSVKAVSRKARGFRWQSARFLPLAGARARQARGKYPVVRAFWPHVSPKDTDVRPENAYVRPEQAHVRQKNPIVRENNPIASRRNYIVSRKNPIAIAIYACASVGNTPAGDD